MSLASIDSIICPTEFDSSKDNFFYADVSITNSSELVHSAQVVFRGYVRKADVLLYEFFHEQQWILVNPSSQESHKIVIDVWLPRFPPTFKFPNGCEIEYAVRATIDPWFENNYVEQLFSVRRSLILKMPHISCYPIENLVNKCIEHGSFLHKKCDPINGTITIEKGAYCHDENIYVTWDLKTGNAEFESYTVKLKQHIELRISDPGNYMATKQFIQVVAEEKTNSDDIRIRVPNDIPISMPMSLWNVLALKYEICLEIKLKKKKTPVVMSYPIIICNEEVAKRKRPKMTTGAFQRIQDVDDDSDDDDDYDSEDDLDANKNRNYSIDIEKLRLMSNTGVNREKPLEKADVEVIFLVNSIEPQPLKYLRLLLTGEARVGSDWYEFLRFKAIANSSPSSLLSPGQHKIQFELPFGESQYDTSILPPSMGDEIRYVVRVTTESLRKNVFARECELLIDRFVDTWAKQEFKSPYFEEYGSTNITMSQRCFKRGKHIIVKVDGNETRFVKGKLIQRMRLRLAGVKSDDSYCSERNVLITEEKILRKTHNHVMQIPFNIPPSIEISYWNVVQIMYLYEINITLEGGHQHTHLVPIWIGCTEDNLQLPVEEAETEEPLVGNEVGTINDEPIDELPEFEVVNPSEVQEQPYWVERVNTDTYDFD